MIPFSLVLFLSCFQVFEFYFLSVVQSKLAVSSYFWAGLISNISKIVGLIYGLDIVFIAYMFVAEYLISGFLLSHYFVSTTERDSELLIPGTIKKLLKSSLPLVLASVSVIIYMKVDQIMLRNLLGLKDVGEYSVAVKLSEMTYFIPVILVGSYFSKWVSLSEAKEDYFNSVNKIYSVLVLFAVLFTVGVWFFGGTAIDLFFGPEYIKSHQIFRIHAFSTIFVFIGVVSSKLLILRNAEKIIFYISILGAVLNILLNLLFIPNYGGLGAAVSTVISQFGAGFLFLFLFVESRSLGVRLAINLKPWHLFKNTKSFLLSLKA